MYSELTVAKVFFFRMLLLFLQSLICQINFFFFPGVLGKLVIFCSHFKFLVLYLIIPFEHEFFSNIVESVIYFNIIFGTGFIELHFPLLSISFGRVSRENPILSLIAFIPQQK